MGTTGVETPARRVTSRGGEGFRYKLIGELRSRRTKLRWGAWLLFLAALCKLGVLLISIALAEGSVTFLTFPLTAIAFAVTRHQLDAVNASLHALIATNAEPGKYRTPVRWLPVFVVGSVLVVLTTLILVAASSGSDDPLGERVQASRTETSFDRSPPVDPADRAVTREATDTGIASTSASEPSAPIFCEAALRGSRGDATECVWTAARDVVVQINEYCSEWPTRHYFTMATGVDDDTVWVLHRGGQWRRIGQSQFADQTPEC